MPRAVKRVAAEPGRIASEAQEMIYDAWEASTPAQRERYARKALTIDLEAIDGYVILALHARTAAERFALLREAMRIGSIVWAPLLKEPPEGYFWGDIDTRPYMRAVHNLALALWEAGKGEEAIPLIDDLLRINPN